MSRYKHFKAFIFGRVGNNLAAIEESKSVRALKKHLGTMEEIIAAQDELLRGYAKEVKEHKDSSIQEKVVDAAIKIFTPKRQLDTGDEYSDEQIQTLLSSMTKEQQDNFLELPVSAVKTLGKARGLSLSDTTVNRARELITGGKNGINTSTTKGAK